MLDNIPSEKIDAHLSCVYVSTMISFASDISSLRTIEYRSAEVERYCSEALTKADASAGGEQLKLALDYLRNEFVFEPDEVEAARERVKRSAKAFADAADDARRRGLPANEELESVALEILNRGLGAVRP